MMRWLFGCLELATGAAILAGAAQAHAADLKLLLPLGRTAYQTNEAIDVALVRSSAEPLAAGNLVLSLTGADGSKMSFTFPVAAVAVEGKNAATAEHLHLNGWLLRPGHYTIEAACDGAAASAEIDLFSHLRRSDFKLINWGRAKGKAQLAEGEDSLGFNLFYGHYAEDAEANFIRGGMDFIPCCTMGGGHQMDLRIECDWSDPYVSRGGTARVVQRTFMVRTRPNVPGIHFYDEPGLTWMKDPVTGEGTPHGIPSQVRSYESAFGRPWLSPHKVRPTANDPASAAQWKQWATWKLGFVDAAWKEAQFGVSYVRPDYISVNQSQYGWSAFTDGYYFNVVRSLPVISGHGGYHDYGPTYFNPSYFLEMARARDLAKPCWYLPTWYGNTTADEFRLEQYLSFQTNIQGMISPPDIDPYEPDKKPAAEGVVESNHLMARLGTIFNTMAVTRPPVALLYSLSHLLEAQVKDRSVCYAHGEAHGRNLPIAYIACKLLQQPVMTVVDEDVADGTLAANHKAVLLTSITYLDPPVVAALEDFAAKGGLVLLTADSTVKIQGAIGLGVKPAMPDQEIINKLAAEKKYQEMGPYVTMGKYFQGATPLAKAIKAQLDKAGIKPTFESDNPYIVATRQAAGDIEYLFAVNAEYDYKAGGALSIKAAVATLAIPDGGGGCGKTQAYDAHPGGPVAELKKQDGQLKGTFRFGPGQMRVIARTARPIGTVKALAPVLVRDLTLAHDPIRVDLGAVLLDANGGVLSGSAPLEIQLVDPLGTTRYDLFRATRQGTLTLSLPLGANDPKGDWKVVVRELLSGTQDTATFAYQPLERCAELAGRTWRAVYFGRDLDNIFRFARVHRTATIVKGTSDYNTAAAERLARILEPWDLHCKIVDAKEVNTPRELGPEEALTWSGIDFGRATPGGKNTPGKVGFAIREPVILLGTPQDNPLIAHLEKMKTLPYAPKGEEFPGRGRGYLAWQRDGIGLGQDSVTAIAYDAAGMAEAVGTLYEAVAGLEPLTPWRMPAAQSVAAATAAPGLLPEPKVLWQVLLPDRAESLTAEGGQVSVLTHDGTLSVLTAEGKVASQKPAESSASAKAAPDARAPGAGDGSEALAKQHAPAGRIVKHVARVPRVPRAGERSGERSGGFIAVGYWGGLLQVLDAAGKATLQQQMPQDICGLAWLGDRLVVGLADGRVLCLAVK